MSSDMGKVFIVHVSDAVLDVAEDVCIASGENDVIVDMDTVGDRMPQSNDQSVIELREVIEEAHRRDANYIHLY